MKPRVLIHVLKAINNLMNNVAAQIPTGWEPKTYSITDDIINQVDPVDLYTLITTVDGLLSIRIVDPYEIYKYIDVSELGNCIGSSSSPAIATKNMFRARNQDKPV
jgi:fatty acid synthase subunit alpha